MKTTLDLYFVITYLYIIKRTWYLRRISTMSSTTIPVSGKSSPEYAAIRGTFESLTIFFGVNPKSAAMRLFQDDLIPEPPHNKDIDTAGLVGSVLACVEHDAIMFYKFLCVLNSFGARGNSELESTSKKFVGECRHYIIDITKSDAELSLF